MNRNRRENKYGLKFIASSNGLEFPLNGRSNNYLHGEVMGLWLNYLWTHCETFWGQVLHTNRGWSGPVYLRIHAKYSFTFPQAQQSNIQQINISRWGKKKKELILIAILNAQSRHDGHRKANAGTLGTIISPVQFTPWLALRTASNNEWSYSR